VIDAGIYALLAADAGVEALVGTSIFAGDAPDDLAQYPCIAYSFVGGSSDPTMSTSGAIRQRVQIDCFAARSSGSLSAGSVAAAIRQAAILAILKAWHPLWPAAPAVLADGTTVLDAVLLDPGTDFVSEQRIFRCMCEFYVQYTLPTA
jgi:hypothetical protein